MGEEGLRGLHSLGQRQERWIGPCDTFEMNVPKGDGELNGEREQRQPASNPPVVTKPTPKVHFFTVAEAKLPGDRDCSGPVGKTAIGPKGPGLSSRRGSDATPA